MHKWKMFPVVRILHHPRHIGRQAADIVTEVVQVGDPFVVNRVPARIGFGLLQVCQHLFVLMRRRHQQILGFHPAEELLKLGICGHAALIAAKAVSAALVIV